jgi:hypothetical protein
VRFVSVHTNLHTSTHLCSFADRDMFCRFAGIGVGHAIQYELSGSTTSGVSRGETSDNDEPGDVGDEDGYDDSVLEDSDGHGDIAEDKDEDEDEDEEDGESSDDCASDGDDVDSECSDSEDEGSSRFKF